MPKYIKRISERVGPSTTIINSFSISILSGEAHASHGGGAACHSLLSLYYILVSMRHFSFVVVDLEN